MFKTATEIAEHTGLSFAQINLILCRAELYKYKTGRKYHITLDFIAEMHKLFQFRKIDQKSTEEKYRLAQAKLMQWKRYIEGRKYEIHN